MLREFLGEYNLLLIFLYLSDTQLPHQAWSYTNKIGLCLKSLGEGHMSFGHALRDYTGKTQRIGFKVLISG